MILQTLRDSARILRYYVCIPNDSGGIPTDYGGSLMVFIEVISDSGEILRDSVGIVSGFWFDPK